MNLDIDPWITRLNSTVKSAQSLRSIEGIADLGQIRSGLYVPPMPSVFVAPGQEIADDNDAVNGLSQRITEEFVVVTAVSNLRDRGSSVHQQLTQIRRALKDNLLLWTPDEYSDPVFYGGGGLWFFDERNLYWRDRYRTRYLEYLTEPV